jgi:hypothetical protein
MILSHRGLLRPAAADGALSAPGEAAISDFPFAEYAKHADDFDQHFRNSIRGADDSETTASRSRGTTSRAGPRSSISAARPERC